jgi:hypothetical protein
MIVEDTGTKEISMSRKRVILCADDGHDYHPS